MTSRSQKTLTESDFKQAAADLGVSVAAIKAVTDVESRGAGFLDDGHPVILFERHIMYRRVKEKSGVQAAETLAKYVPALVNPTAGGYGKTSEQPARMQVASMLDRNCALESASWGLFQIMGYHWKVLGYASLQEFVNAMYASEGGHLDAFVRFIKVNPALTRALKALDWPAFARGYNGPAYRVNKYDEKMAAAYDRYRKQEAA